MMELPSEQVSELLERTAQGEEDAAANLLPLVYDRLRALACSYFQHERRDHTLEPTALVHEAFVKLVRGENTRWKNRAHFFAVAARAMRQILADHARAKQAAKRGGGCERITLSGLVTPPDLSGEVDLIALDNALDRMTQDYPDQARVVELRFLGGLEVAEAADVLGVSVSTVERWWRLGRAWLRRELSGEVSP